VAATSRNITTIGDTWTLFGVDMQGDRIAMYSSADSADPPPTPPLGIAAWL